MAKYKPATGKKKEKKSIKSAIPCFILIVLIFGLMMMLFAAWLKK